MSFFSPDGWPQELAALVVVAAALLYVVKRLTGYPRLPRRTPPEQVPDQVRMGGRLSRGLKKAEKNRR